MKITEQENKFFIVFEDLITTFSDDRNLKSDNEQMGFSKDFISSLESILSKPSELDNIELASRIESYEPSQNPKLNKKFEDFMIILKDTDFRFRIIPYDRITEYVFENTPEEIIHKFTKDLHARGKTYFQKGVREDNDIQVKNEDFEKKFYKILRHIDLALVQKNTFSRLQLKEIDNLKKDYQNLSDRYTKLKEDAEIQYKNMTTHFITILGIFAAILMGVFGAIQGFSNIFENAHRLNLGIILIMSSIGASSVLLILFFLLNGIAKLTDKNLSSTSNENGLLLEKHPTLIIAHGILIFISLIGTSLELSNIKLQFALQGLWWILPLFWIIYFIIALHKRNLLFFIDWFKSKKLNEGPEIKDSDKGDYLPG